MSIEFARLNASVLLVEDSVTDRLLFETAFRDAFGFEPELLSATSLAEARGILDEHSPAFVFLDMHLPDGSGLDLVKYAHELQRDLFLIVLTGDDRDELTMLTINAGVHDLFNKDELNPRMLRRTVYFAEMRRRTNQAMQFALERSEKLANQRSEFLSFMTHEVRSPLNAIVGFASLLEDSCDQGQCQLDAGGTECLGEILKSSRHMVDLLNDLLDFNRLELGKIDTEAEPCRLIDIFAEASSLFSLQAASKSLQLTNSVDPEVPDEILTYPKFLRQILQNLIGNAVKFTQEGAIHVRASLNETLEGETTVEIQVKDTGAGIPSERLSTIFDAYEQIQPGSIRDSGGSGLGLAISQRFAHLMAGHLRVDSVEGQGSTFTLEFPLRVGIPANANL